MRNVWLTFHLLILPEGLNLNDYVIMKQHKSINVLQLPKIYDRRTLLGLNYTCIRKWGVAVLLTQDYLDQFPMLTEANRYQSKFYSCRRTFFELL